MAATLSKRQKIKFFMSASFVVEIAMASSRKRSREFVMQSNDLIQVHAPERKGAAASGLPVAG